MPIKRIQINKIALIASAMAFFMLLTSFYYSPAVLFSRIKFELSDKSNYVLALNLVNEGISTITADPANRLVLKSEVRGRSGEPIVGARVNVSAALNDNKPSKSGFDNWPYETDRNGEIILTYSPPGPERINEENADNKVTITVSLPGGKTTASVSLKLIPDPVVFVHGYQASGKIFDNMKEYLESKGLEGNEYDYDTSSGVARGAEALKEELKKLKDAYTSMGVQVRGFDLIAHSMGGLVARYYTSSRLYSDSNNVNKIIFISVPQKGSHLASLGLSYFDDQGIKDLVPDSTLFNTIMPSLTNKGINPLIQTASLLDQYDEVVSPESASLDDWNIKTEVFDVGANNFDVNALLNGNLTSSQNHKLILDNKKVFERIVEMLYQKLPFPSKN